VKPARHSRAKGKRKRGPAEVPLLMTSINEIVLSELFHKNMIARLKPTLPIRHIHKARKALVMAMGVLSWLIKPQQANVVISQKNPSQSRLLAKTSPFIAPRNMSIKKKNLGCVVSLSSPRCMRCSSWSLIYLMAYTLISEPIIEMIRHMIMDR
jgi:hypothetical protein